MMDMHVTGGLTTRLEPTVFLRLSVKTSQVQDIPPELVKDYALEFYKDGELNLKDSSLRFKMTGNTCHPERKRRILYYEVVDVPCIF